jgi:hypothetical protein
MGVNIRDANHDPARTGTVWRRDLLNGNDRRVADAKLHTVIANAQTFGKAERAAQPLGGGANIDIGQLGNDRAGRHGTIGKHWISLRCETYRLRFSCGAFRGSYRRLQKPTAISVP